MVGQHDDRRRVGQAAAIERRQEPADLRIEERHGGRRRQRARPVGVVRAVEREQMEEQQVRLVPLEDVHGRVRPHLVAPGGGGALVERLDVARRDQARGDHLASR